MAMCGNHIKGDDNDNFGSNPKQACSAALHRLLQSLHRFETSWRNMGSPSPTSGKAANLAGKSKGKLPPKYMNPKTGETWSGHARAPGWIAGVKDRTKFLLDGSAANKNVGVTGKTKGALPPKYLDPKSGMTWSGRGRVPAWMANAKDRSKYLIAGATQATA